jgi:hypothetical protein
MRHAAWENANVYGTPGNISHRAARGNTNPRNLVRNGIANPILAADNSSCPERQQEQTSIICSARWIAKLSARLARGESPAMLRTATIPAARRPVSSAIAKTGEVR